MEEIELKQLWASYNANLDVNIKMNQKIVENTTDLRVKSLLGSMRFTKIALIIIGILWVIFLDTVIINTFGIASIFFTVSAIIQVLITKLSIGIYIYQLIMIQQVDTSKEIIQTQKKLSSLKTTSLTIARISFLQLPVWSTFYLHKTLFIPENIVALAFQALCTSALAYLAVWLFMNIKLENKNKPWFKLIFDGKGWQPVIQSMELLEDIKEFRK